MTLNAIYSITDSSLLQIDLNSLYGWSLDNPLSFNIKKCVVLHFKANPNETINYSINSIDLTNITKHRGLGVIFFNNLSWTDHIESTVAKVTCSTLSNF